MLSVPAGGWPLLGSSGRKQAGGWGEGGERGQRVERGGRGWRGRSTGPWTYQDTLRQPFVVVAGMDERCVGILLSLRQKTKPGVGGGGVVHSNPCFPAPFLQIVP